MSASPQRILITGAASGLGLALSARYAADGWRVLMTDLKQSALDAAIAGLPAASRARVDSRPLDVRSDADWEAARGWCTEQHGGLDVLVNNAGVAGGGRFVRTPIEDWDWILEINLKGTIRGCQAFAPLFQAQGHGHLVNVASLAGLLNPPAMGSYNVVKAGVVSLSETLRFELERDGVMVSVVCPSFFRTGLATSLRTPDPAVERLIDRLVTRSPYPAAGIATAIQRGIAARRFLILTDRDGRLSYLVKRFVPPLYRREVRRRAGRLLQHLEAA